MPRFDVVCPNCQRVERDVYLRGGDHPVCECGTVTEYLWNTPVTHGIQTDESFIGGLTVENMGNKPVTVYSRAEFKEEMLKRGLEQRIKWAGPDDKYLINHAALMDPYTLESATQLVRRIK